MARVVAEDYVPRLERAADAVRDARGALNLRVRERDRIIVEAHDHGGLSQRQILKAAGLTSTGTITSILARSQEDDGV
jgi:hypothetical protein